MKPHTPPVPKVPQWCSVIPSRNPEVKYHHHRGHAKTAFLQWWRGQPPYQRGEQWLRPGKLYLLVNGEWELQYEVAQGDRKSTHPMFVKEG